MSCVTVPDAVLKVLKQGSVMREHQKAYFARREQAELDASRAAERAFDEVLADAWYFVRYGEPRPRQTELGL